MRLHFIVFFIASATLLVPGRTHAQTKPWNNAGLGLNGVSEPPKGSPGPAPRRDLSGIWDPGPGGVQPGGYNLTSLFTPRGQEMAKANKPGNGPRIADVSEDNDPLSTLGDPAGFPRILLYELRPFQIAQTTNQVLMFYMFEKVWRVIWTDGRELPKDPDPRWYGYSVGRWEDDYTFVVQSFGLDDRTWLDNAGNPHSTSMRVVERYHRADRDTPELTGTLYDPVIYKKPFTPLNKLAMKLMPNDTDLMEMITSASDAQAYKKEIANQAKRKQ